MHKYEVGKLYNPTKTSWTEGALYNFRGGQHELVVFLDNPSDAETAAYRWRPVQLGFAERFGLISLLCRPEGLLWSDSPYSWWKVPPEERVPPPSAEEHTPDTRAILNIILVNARDGIIRVLRVLTMSPKMTRLLHAAIYRQFTAPLTDEEYNTAVHWLWSTYPNTDSMVPDAVVTCTGGE